MDAPQTQMSPGTTPGRYGAFGGQYVAETLMAPLVEVEAAFEDARRDPVFLEEFELLSRTFIGRPSPLYYAERITERVRREAPEGCGAAIYFKRDELNHTGAHKINNALGQALLARRMGKARVIAETGAGQHGVATAAAAARLGLGCTVYMGADDMLRQSPNVFRMRLLGAEVISVEAGRKTLKDAMNEALRAWTAQAGDALYVIGTAAGPHPYPTMARHFQSIIGTEARGQMLETTGRLPDLCVACVGGGSNAIGLFSAFLDDEAVELIGVEAAGIGVDTTEHAATLSQGRPGILHGARSYVLQNEDGQIRDAHSISAGLDYPGVGPEHSYLKETGRVRYLSATDDQAIAAFQICSREEGILPALEPAHALAITVELAKARPAEDLILMNLCGRGDKDLETVAKALGTDLS
jgi:tryptophan synthase beta chain